MAQLALIRQNQAGNAHIDGATTAHSPKSGWECPHRWRKSGKGLMRRRKNLFLIVFASANPHEYAELPWWGRAYCRQRKSGRGLMIRTGQSSVCKCLCQCQPSLACQRVSGGIRVYKGLAPSMSPIGSSMLIEENGCNPAQKIATNKIRFSG